jgi:predicted O-methyltransferase YrrM
MGMSTVLGLKPQGFFIPYRFAGTVQPAGYPAQEPWFESAAAGMAEVMDWIASHAARLGELAGPAPLPRWDQDWFPRLDGAAAYAIVRQVKPCRIVEIGSGHSTRFMARAIADAGMATELVCIDPEPRATLKGLNVRHVQSVLGDASLQSLRHLSTDDILFVDSSHIAVPGTDVDRLLGDVLPGLPAGILLHLHDIFLPDAYPEAWSWRGYNEQLPVACLIQGGAFSLRFASHWVATRRPDWIAAAGLGAIPKPAGAFETSLWLRKER